MQCGHVRESDRELPTPAHKHGRKFGLFDAPIQKTSERGPAKKVKLHKCGLPGPHRTGSLSQPGPCGPQTSEFSMQPTFVGQRGPAHQRALSLNSPLQITKKARQTTITFVIPFIPTRMSFLCPTSLSLSFSHHSLPFHFLSLLLSFPYPLLTPTPSITFA